jgi:hypothetical protein
VGRPNVARVNSGISFFQEFSLNQIKLSSNLPNFIGSSFESRLWSNQL